MIVKFHVPMDAKHFTKHCLLLILAIPALASRKCKHPMYQITYLDAYHHCLIRLHIYTWYGLFQLRMFMANGGPLEHCFR
jgi:hypothetical protein